MKEISDEASDFGGSGTLLCHFPLPPFFFGGGKPLMSVGTQSFPIGGGSEGETWEWYAHGSGGSYESDTIKLGSFSTFRDFYRHYNNIPHPKRVFYGNERLRVRKKVITAFSIFKAGISPAWEDASNQKGGSVQFRGPLTPSFLESFWLPFCILALNRAGEGVNGVRLACRLDPRKRQTVHKVEVWLSSTSSSLVDQVSSVLKEEFPTLTFRFVPHSKE